MLTIEGIYQNGQLSLSKKVECTQPVKVIVTFLEEQTTLNEEQLEKLVAQLYANDNITFKQAQCLLNHQNWQDTVTILEQQGCQLYYDKEDFEADLETLALLEKNSQ